MDESIINEIFKAHLTDTDFDRLSQFVFQQSGIKMPPVKKIMLQSRLQKRLRELKISSYKEYADYLFSPQGQENEIIHMLDVVSTNKTDFYREPVHFEFLQNEILPEFVKENPIQNFKVWSAGCSSGEEPYTIAITLNEFQMSHLKFKYSILGTDISLQILQKAALAVFKEDRICHIPLKIKTKYFLRSKDREHRTVRVVSELRNKIKYERLNFMDESYHVLDKFEVIFCRNVLIYFDRATQEKVINRLCQKLKSGGYLFIGHSESILGMNLPLQQIKPTIYKRL